MIIRFLLDPRLFNYVILTLYAVNAIRWAFERSAFGVIYWGGAFVITFAVTFLSNR